MGSLFAWILQSPPATLELILAGTALYLLPGYALLQLLWPVTARPLTSAERFAAAAGVGFALPPLFLLAARLAGVTWSTAATWLYIALALAVLLVPWAVRLARGQRSHHWRSLFTWELGVLVALTLLALLVRLYTVRDYQAGLFGDSYHHTLIVQLLLDNGGLFDSYQPYAPLASFTYHFGFHADVAYFAWLTGTPTTLSVLAIGQLMNAASVPLAFLFTSRVLASARRADALPIAAIAGIWAAVLTGFVNLMPAYYVNWGRYTQLAGQLILPMVVVGWVELLERAAAREVTIRTQARLLVLCGVLTACLMLTHYIVTIFAAVMVGAYALALVLHAGRWRAAAQTLGPALLGTALALLIALPWIRHTLGGGMARNASLMVSGGVSADRIATYTALAPITPMYLKEWVLALAGAGLLVALAQRHWRAIMFAVWSGLLMLLITPQTFGLPGAGIVDQFTVYIALYVTVLPLAGFALAAGQAWLVDKLSAVNQRLARPAVQIGLLSAVWLVISLWGVIWLQGVSEPSRQMLTPADNDAIAWIRDNIPKDARLLVNTFPTYGGTLIAGTDGGVWIPLLTGRQTNLPPMLYGSERFEQDDFYARTQALPEALRDRPMRDGTPGAINLTTPAHIRRLREEGIRYIYSGANQTPGPELADQIDTATLRQSNHFQLIYDRSGVKIFELVQ